MSDTEQEPSMEEILASIRRIISDDDKEIEAAAQEKEEVPEGKEELLGEETVAMAEPEPEPDPEPDPEPAAEEVDDDDDDDILDLTDMEAPDPEPLFEEQAYKEPEPEPVAPQYLHPRRHRLLQRQLPLTLCLHHKQAKRAGLLKD